MKILKIDEKWSVEYDETCNDRPVQVLRYGEPSGAGVSDWKNDTTAMFYALLDALRQKENNNDKMSATVSVLVEDIDKWRIEWLEANDPQDGTDCVTPFDHYLYNAPAADTVIPNSKDIAEHRKLYDRWQEHVLGIKDNK